MIRYEVSEAIATITLNRPQALNAYCIDMGDELVAAFRRANDEPSVRALVITGAGRGFCAGADRKYLGQGFKDESGRRLGDEEFVQTFAAKLLTFPKPVIAAINGPAVGIGVTMSLLCDLRVAAEPATLSLSFARIGVMMGLGSTLLLPRLIGHGKTMEILLTQPTLDAAEAARIGLVNAVVPATRLQQEARRFAAAAAECAPAVVHAIKRAIAFAASAPLAEVLRFELERGRELSER
jgi:2-(1,2-epoxy-1,2-dihydrophenyl)acetyl-CoA isomerase